MWAGESTVEDLVVAAQDGDQRAWLELMVRFDGMVHRVAASFRLQDADAADVVQTTWLSAFERLGSLRAPERFGGWLRAIVRNECRDLYGRAARERPAEDVGDAAEESSPGPEGQALRSEAARAVREAVAALPRRNRILVECLYFSSQSDYASAARETGIPLGGVGPTRARVLVVLRDRLARHGHGPARILDRAG